jgi:sugar phosphate isomerase/epimerase
MPGPLRTSVQIYSVRNAGTLEDQLDIVAAAGFRHVELREQYLLDDPALTREMLDLRHLAVSSGHVGIAALRERFNAIVNACKSIGVTALFMPSVPPAERDSPGAYWSALGRELGEFSLRMLDNGIALGYHNHDWELRTKESGVKALQLLLDASAFSPLGWQVDVAWLIRGQADPLPWLERYAGRVVSVHVKDLALPGENLDEDGWADPGLGTIDWSHLAACCRAAGARWLVAEHDNPRDPVRFATNAFAFLEKLKGDAA